MKWTKEKPTKEGYYWYCGTNEYDESEVREVIYDYTFEFFGSRSFENGDRWEPVSDLPGEWSSEPIQLPERK